MNPSVDVIRAYNQVTAQRAHALLILARWQAESLTGHRYGANLDELRELQIALITEVCE